MELASRLSFFLWSSIPDDELLDLAARGELSRPDVLEQQVRRMLADERSRSLVSNFAGQWLYLRNLDSVIPDMRLFPDFDDNLRQALRQETELFFESILREDRSVLDLIKADYTFLNERLAKHYGIPHVYGSRFRRVSLDDGEPPRRAAAARQHPDGDFVRDPHFARDSRPLGAEEPASARRRRRRRPTCRRSRTTPSPRTLSVRERLKQHRANAACASCHELMDPVGFALENFDAVGRWRETEAGQPIDASGGLPDGSEFVGVAGPGAGLAQPPGAVRANADREAADVCAWAAASSTTTRRPSARLFATPATTTIASRG